jgi:hypothetical protein
MVRCCPEGALLPEDDVTEADPHFVILADINSRYVEAIGTQRCDRHTRARPPSGNGVRLAPAREGLFEESSEICMPKGNTVSGCISEHEHAARESIHHGRYRRS